MATDALELRFKSTGAIAALWIGMLGPAAIWFARLAISYALVPYQCTLGSAAPVNIATGVALLLIAGTGVLAWRMWRAAGGGTDAAAHGVVARSRFMAIFGMLSSALFFAVVIAEGLAGVYVHACL